MVRRCSPYLGRRTPPLVGAEGKFVAPACGTFKAGGGFPPHIHTCRRCSKLSRSIAQLIRLTLIARSTLISDDDNKVLHVSFEAGSTRNTVMHEMIVDRFWLQMDHDFMPKLRWINSKANAEADAMSRLGLDDLVDVDETTFIWVALRVRRGI